jgi:tetratricopeptide (TPR) repeat protein
MGALRRGAAVFEREPAAIASNGFDRAQAVRADSQCHRLGGRLEEALATCREGQRHYPHDLELLFHESVVRKHLGDGPGAEGCLLRLQFASEGDHFASVNPALRSAIARHNLGVLYREEGRDAEAETYWQAVVADNPDYLPS